MSILKYMNYMNHASYEEVQAIKSNLRAMNLIKNSLISPRYISTYISKTHLEVTRKSALVEHVAETKHIFDFENAKKMLYIISKQTLLIVTLKMTLKKD
ncbi:CLUMA_CG020108, isoform A [Clunio marinus]|uniref:CLUMA_CG020108, isoform A n=1 Tax=Clunio marinus TaxID=568069 RepID=A0A1J1J3Y4_9DIPT|nr:CLUMA_CG020108, isoform A [Clunio marinus]